MDRVFPAIFVVRKSHRSGEVTKKKISRGSYDNDCLCSSQEQEKILLVVLPDVGLFLIVKNKLPNFVQVERKVSSLQVSIRIIFD